MAEAIARSVGGGRVEARSAGLSPLGWVADETRNALHTLGYSAEGLSSKGLSDVELDGVDVVVSLLGYRGLDCLPRGIGAHREAWTIADPFGEDEEVYLEVARELERRVQKLLDEELDPELFAS
jgi:arsenate reductase